MLSDKCFKSSCNLSGTEQVVVLLERNGFISRTKRSFFCNLTFLVLYGILTITFSFSSILDRLILHYFHRKKKLKVLKVTNNTEILGRQF